jgi:hypothetical protein
MILYNETVGIDKDIEQQFLIWLKSYYIPEVMKTNLFSGFRIYKVLSHEDESSTSYSVQFFSGTIEQILAFINNHSKTLLYEQQKLFKDKHITFRTLLEEVA